MHARTRRLRDIMEQHRLTPAMVGRLVGVSNRTVMNWRLATSDRPIPAHRLDLLELRLQFLPRVGGDE